MAKNTVVLMILDGWGIGAENESNPIHVVQPPFIKSLGVNYPMTSLQASGISVGLPWGEVGNSEVGHLTIGAGKVIYQYYPRITLSIQDGSFYENEVLKNACSHVKTNSSALNLVGILTKGNVHAAVDHIEALIDMATREGVTNINLHLFADGKDSPPRSFFQLLGRLPKEKLATVIGRYYAMDREGNWSLTEETYKLLTGTSGVQIDESGLRDAVENMYQKGHTEEFLPPLRLGGEEKNIRENDAVIFFNYREDSIRQIAEAFVNPEFDKFQTIGFKNLFVATMTRYKETFKAPVVFPPDFVTNPLGKVLANFGKTQLRLAESFKYAHVTYFFNGHHEPPFKGEYRVLVPSDATPYPAEKPEMMAPALTERLIQSVQEGAYDFVLINYANPDTIGHSGNYEAAQEVVRIMDKEIEKIVKAIEGSGATLVITSDHGNLEEVIDPQTGRMETQHDPSPVPLYIIGDTFKGRRFQNQDNIRNETLGVLSDVAPTVLEIMKIPQPLEMTGKSLLRGLI